jgi:hypothetical protein
MLVPLLSLLVCVAGCDPGWNYHVPDLPPERADRTSAELGISVVAQGGLFTSSLWVDVDVRNDDSVPLVVGATPFRVLDAARRPLPWHRGHATAQPCDTRTQGAVTLANGDVCKMRGAFEVRALSAPFRRNQDLRTLTIVIDGLTRGRTPISRSVVLEWD